MTITGKYRLASFLSVLLSFVLSGVLSTVSGILSSDIMVTGSGSSFIRFLPDALNYVGIFFGAAAIGVAVASVFYALVYFGKRTAMKSGLVSVGCSFLYAAVSVIYAALSNNMGAARLIAAALVLLIDIAYFTASLAAAGFVCSMIFKRTCRLEKEFSPVAPAAVTWAAVLFIHVADLTLSSVLPFVLNNTVIATDVYTIVGDYIYYVIVYGLLPFAVTLAAMPIFGKVTGALVEKRVCGSNK